MAGVTGVELGPDTCILTRVHPGARGLHVFAVHGLDARDPRPGDADFVARLREVRRRRRLPRRARAVIWGRGDPPSIPQNGAAELDALARAGFVLEAVYSPAQALATLSRHHAHSPGAAEAWVAVNEDRGCIAIVERGELLFSRTLEWSPHPGSGSVRDELLRRYLLVARLAPELQHAIGVVREQRGVHVEAVVLCGNLPDLRSLTMPLLEELGLHVGTLDSAEGILLAPSAAVQTGASTGPIRLACAAVLPAPPRTRQSAGWLRAAAALALAGLAAAWIALRPDVAGEPPAGRLPEIQEPDHGLRGAPEPAPAAAGPGAEDPPTISPEGTAGDGHPAGGSSSGNAVPAPTAGRGVPAPAAGGIRMLPPRVTPAAPRQRDRTEASGGPTGPSHPALEADSAAADGGSGVPTLNSISAAPGRKLAVLDGEVVREGDTVGPWVVASIEPDAVLLRGQAGREVRLSIRRGGAGER